MGIGRFDANLIIAAVQHRIAGSPVRPVIAAPRHRLARGVATALLIEAVLITSGWVLFSALSF
jgi:hypothetical protein